MPNLRDETAMSKKQQDIWKNAPDATGEDAQCDGKISSHNTP
jgi:hypothetical protein